MSMEELGMELKRLGCGVRNCGSHGYIFMPQHSGGINVDGSKIHFWDRGVNYQVDSRIVWEKLSALPDGAGFEQTWKTLLQTAA